MAPHVLAVYDGAYGIQTHVNVLSRELRKRGFDVTVCSMPKISGDKIDATFILRVLEPLVRSSCTAGALARKVRRVDIDLIHVHSARIPLILGYLFHRIWKVPLIVTIHERDSLALRANRLLKKARKIIAISPEVKIRLMKLGANKENLVVIPNMIDTCEFSPEENTSAPYWSENSFKGHLRIVSLGRADCTKTRSLEIVMDLMPKIVEKFPKVQLLIAGDGPAFRGLAQLAQRINGQIGKEAIAVLGRVPSAVDLLRRADVVIGIGRVALEAMATGKPVIAVSGQAGQPVRGDIVTQETATALAECNFSGRNCGKRLDSIRMLELIARLLENEDYRKQVGSWGRLFVKQNFDSATIARLTESVYSESLRNGTS
jgi:glycosyltransferase involved in cell wall biosynthesis